MKETHSPGPEASRETKEYAELKPKHKVFISIDRYKTIGLSTFSIDPRKAGIFVRYDFKNKRPKSAVNGYFNDDHYRGINRFFGGGRDNRNFSVERDPESDAQLTLFKKTLREHKDELIRRERELTHKEIRYPERLFPKLHEYKHTSRVENYEGDMSTRTDYSHELAWHDNVHHSPLSRRQLTNVEEQNPQQVLETTIENGPNEDDINKTLDAQELYRESLVAEGCEALEREIAQLTAKIENYESSQGMIVDIELYSANDPEYQTLKQLLGENESVMFDDGNIPPLDFLTFTDLPKDKLATPVPNFPSRDTRKQLLLDEYRKSYPKKVILPPPAQIVPAKEVGPTIVELALKKARIEAELTPDVVAKITNEINTLQAFIRILEETPSQDDEVRKIIKSLPSASHADLARSLREKTRGLDILDEVDRLQSRINQLIERKKLNEVFPKLKERALVILEKWQGIPAIVVGDDEARMLIDDGATTEQDLVTKVQTAFLRDPWSKDPKKVLKNTLTDIVESI